MSCDICGGLHLTQDCPYQNGVELNDPAWGTEANGLHNITQEAEDMADQFFADPPEPLYPSEPEGYEGTGHD